MRKRALDVVSQVLDVPVEQIDEASSPESIEAWDSLRHMNLVLALEEEFGIQFTDDRIVQMLNVEAILAAVTELSHA